MGTKVLMLACLGVVANAAACRESVVRTDTLELPLCEPAEVDADYVLEAGAEGASGFEPLVGEPPVLPTINLWQAVGAPLLVKLRGLAPEGVRGRLSWEVDGEPIGEQDFASDLICDGTGQPDPVPLMIRMGTERGTAETYSSVPGHMRIAVAPAGTDPVDCPDDAPSLDPEAPAARDCLVLDADVVFTFADALEN